jgi:hypothetical protein
MGSMPSRGLLRSATHGLDAMVWIATQCNTDGLDAMVFGVHVMSWHGA